MGKFLKTGFIAIGVIVVLACFFITTPRHGSSIRYSEFIEKIENGEIERVEVGAETITAYAYEGKKVYSTYRMDDDNLIGTMRDSNVQFEQTGTSSGDNIIFRLLRLLMYVSPLIFFFILIKGIGKEGDGGGMNILPTQMGMAKNKSRLYENKSNVTFKDVAGQEEAKESLGEIIDYLHNNKKYTKIGARIPKGVLLVGPPGTGKTLIAKAVAGEADVPFYSLSGSDFVEMFVGVGASRVRDLFETAKKNAPCIIFIDEIDAIGSARSTAATNGHNEYEQTLNQLLSEMDGFETDKTVIVIGATNRPEVLDKALLRTGRFDRRIIVDKPDLKERMAVLKVHADGISMDDTVDFNKVALATSGAVGSDLANIVNEAALNAVRRGRKSVSQEDLMGAVELIFTGKEKKDRLLNDDEKKIIAYHEIGHAVMAAVQKNTAPIQKITIIPRTMGSLGYTMQVPEEERYLMSREDILSETRTLLAGRTAEEIFCDTVTTGASNDIERATKQIRSAITMYGMSDMFDMVALESMQNIYLNTESVLTVSQETGSVVDWEVCRIIKVLHSQVADILHKNKPMVDEIAEFLIKNENMSGEEFMKIFRKYVKPEDGCISLDNSVFMSTDGRKEERNTFLSVKPGMPVKSKKVSETIKTLGSDRKEPWDDKKEEDKPVTLKQEDGPDKAERLQENEKIDEKTVLKESESVKNNEKKKVALKLDVCDEKEKKQDGSAEKPQEGKTDNNEGKESKKRDSVSPFEVAKASAKKQKEKKKEDVVINNNNDNKKNNDKKEQPDSGDPIKKDDGNENHTDKESGNPNKNSDKQKKGNQAIKGNGFQGKGKAQKTARKDDTGMEALMNEICGNPYNNKKNKKKEEPMSSQDDDISEDMY